MPHPLPEWRHWRIVGREKRSRRQHSGDPGNPCLLSNQRSGKAYWCVKSRSAPDMPPGDPDTRRGETERAFRVGGIRCPAWDASPFPVHLGILCFGWRDMRTDRNELEIRSQHLLPDRVRWWRLQGCDLVDAARKRSPCTDGHRHMNRMRLETDAFA